MRSIKYKTVSTNCYRKAEEGRIKPAQVRRSVNNNLKAMIYIIIFLILVILVLAFLHFRNRPKAEEDEEEDDFGFVMELREETRADIDTAIAAYNFLDEIDTQSPEVLRWNLKRKLNTAKKQCLLILADSIKELSTEEESEKEDEE